MTYSLISWLVLTALPIAAVLYLIRLNRLLQGTPCEARKLLGPAWTSELLDDTYKRIFKSPIDYTNRLPPRLERRYIVTGGNGLVGGHIVLQLLARGTPPKSIRIIDIRQTERNDMLNGPATEVDFVQTDITSATSVDAAFDKPWDPSVAKLPLTVFHTAAVIIPSARSKYLYGFPEAVNVQGTKNILAAARRVGADIFSSTSSASIGIRPVEAFAPPWFTEPRNYWQILDESDFSRPLRPHEEFFGNYPASKAAAERLVCAQNDEHFRTGCIRPANGVYGNPTDNLMGGPLAKEVLPTWLPHVIQSFVHGANVAIAHLHHEAVLVRKDCPQAGRPFVVTDPNPPITYGDMYSAIKTLSIHPFRLVLLPPIVILLMSYAVEWYTLLPYRFPFLKGVLPDLEGDVKYLQPGMFSICTHLVGSDAEAKKPVNEGGLGYEGVLTTLEGMVMEVMEWNREHSNEYNGKAKRAYTTSVSLAEKIQQLGAVGSTVKA
ncbi:cholesterol dehydrogenase [Fusarium albosuccineum]|uniref:Cholesterol dehydrogenase n=1 Tax=Fusarium albosuccineum TaxID=1237068 RepID=A0A8H4LL30_9HYPO|nr:cholesterol dehydrogenase [Fusarium albosuccineum]